MSDGEQPQENETDPPVDAGGSVEFTFPTLRVPKVAIVGFASGTAHKAPFSDDGVETWGINQLWKVLPDRRWDRWFELHSLYDFYHANPGHQEFLRDLASKGVPVYVREQDYVLALEWGITSAQPFPHRVILEQFRPYFTNTVSWLVALAIMMRPDELLMYGVDMAQDHITASEYCVAPESRILTAGLEWVPAEQIKVGDDLVGFDEFPPEGSTYRQYRSSKVTAVKELMRPSYRLHMADGTKLVSSQEHRWLADYGNGHQWFETSDLHDPIVNPEIQEQIRADYGPYRVNRHSENGVTHRGLAEKYGVSRATIQRTIAGTLDPDDCRTHRLVKAMEPWDEDRSWGAGFLAAAFDGEGYLTMNRRDANANGTIVKTGYAQRANAMAAHVETELDARGFAFTKRLQKASGTCYDYTLRGGRSEILRLLGTVRAPRLIDKFDPDMLGIVHTLDAVEIVEKEYLGETTVVAITTETGTFIAEGYLSHNSEQRPSCEYYLGIAEGTGVKVHVPNGADLLGSTHLYGYEDSGRALEKMVSRFTELESNKQQMAAQAAQLESQAAQIRGTMQQMTGAQQEVNYWRKNWLTPPATEET